MPSPNLVSYKPDRPKFSCLNGSLADLERIDVKAFIEDWIAFVILRPLQVDRLLGVGSAGADQEAIEAQLALLAEHESNVAIERKVEASAGIEFFGPLGGDRIFAVERLEQVQPLSLSSKPSTSSSKTSSPRELRIVPLLGVDGERVGDSLGLVAARQRKGPDAFERVVVRKIKQRGARDDARRKARAILEDDIDRSANALAVEVCGRRADDFDPVDNFGRDTVDKHAAIVAAARDRPPVDENLCKPAPRPRKAGASYSPMSLPKATPGTRFSESPTDVGSNFWKNSWP